jgi:hypothetical protein
LLRTPTWATFVGKDGMILPFAASSWQVHP